MPALRYSAGRAKRQLGSCSVGIEETNDYRVGVVNALRESDSFGVPPPFVQVAGQVL